MNVWELTREWWAAGLVSRRGPGSSPIQLTEYAAEPDAPPVAWSAPQSAPRSSEFSLVLEFLNSGILPVLGAQLQHLPRASDLPPNWDPQKNGPSND